MTADKDHAPSTAGEMLQRAREFLARKQVAESRLDAELLVAHALGLDRLRLFMQLDRPLSREEIDRARELLVRRARHEPVAYVTGRREFYGRSFEVTRDVLIPRPETELLVDIARTKAKDASMAGRALAIGDVGTGSGCIAITLALEVGESIVSAVDISAAALACARQNAERLGASVRFVEGDGPRALSADSNAPQGFDLIVCNPPYVTEEERAGLAPEVRDFEPALALFAPAGDPHHWVRRLLEEAVPMLAPGGGLLVELGHTQAAAALALAQSRGLTARTHRDYGGVERVLDIAARMA